jgi:hypothetical protein
MWTALAIIALLVSLIGYGLFRAKTQGKLEEKLRVDKEVLEQIGNAKKIRDELANTPTTNKRLWLKRKKLLSDISSSTDD